jgi:hypothetical protein
MFTNQRELRRAFWDAHPKLPRRMIRSYSGLGKMYPTDTRTAWVDWLDSLRANGEISRDLADRAELNPRESA